MIVKQTITENSLNLGGTLEEITGLHNSCFNFNNNFNSELLEMSPDFLYFSINYDDYIYARAKNIHYNWKYENWDGTPHQRYLRTKMAHKLSEIQAKMEIDTYPCENFLPNNQDFAAHTYSFGFIPDDLEAADKTEEFQNKENPPMEDKIEVIVV